MDITDVKGKKVPTPSIEQVLNAVNQRGFFLGFKRYQYPCDVDAALQIVEAIGKSRNPKFVIDDENRFTYTNFIKWVHGDTSMQCINPETKMIVPGRLKRGIYIAGNTGSGKSWCLDIMQAYSMAMGFKITFADDRDPRPLYWGTFRADAICATYVETGNIQTYKARNILGIQDFGSEPQESIYMGNRLDVIRQLIEYRGDKCDELTLITSNLRINGDLLNDRYGARVASRLVEMCNYLEIKGKDRRKGQ